VRQLRCARNDDEGVTLSRPHQPPDASYSYAGRDNKSRLSP
jgi:hypothetical protein